MRSHGTQRCGCSLARAADETRTHDLVLTKDALYQLSYSSLLSHGDSIRIVRVMRLLPIANFCCRSPVSIRPNPCFYPPEPNRPRSTHPTTPAHPATLDPTSSAFLERVKGIEPSSLAWKAMALPLSYTRAPQCPMGGAGFEPAKAVPSDLQSDPFDRSGNPPRRRSIQLRLREKARREPSPIRTSGHKSMPRQTRGFRYELAEGLEPTTC